MLLFLTDLLAALPAAALGAILIASAFSLFDFGGLMALRRYSRSEHAALETVTGEPAQHSAGQHRHSVPSIETGCA